MRAKKVLSILFALALVLSSLPASAIAESIEDAGKYSVVVSYVNVLNDEEIHAPSKQVVNEGESWSVTAPTITGYDLEDPAQATVTGVASGSDHYIKQTVYYTPGYVTYTIFPSNIRTIIPNRSAGIKWKSSCRWRSYKILLEREQHLTQEFERRCRRRAAPIERRRGFHHITSDHIATQEHFL